MTVAGVTRIRFVPSPLQKPRQFSNLDWDRKEKAKPEFITTEKKNKHTHAFL